MVQGRHVYQGNGLLLRGGIGIAFGILAVVTPELFISPGNPAIGLLLIFLSMLTALVALSTEPSERGRRGTLLLFLLSLGAGGATLVSTGLQDPMFFAGLAGWLFLTGISEFSLAFTEDLQDFQGILGVAGILNVAFGMILIVMDIRAPAPLLLALGLFIFIFGIFSMFSAILIRLGSGVTFD